MFDSARGKEKKKQHKYDKEYFFLYFHRLNTHTNKYITSVIFSPESVGYCVPPSAMSYCSNLILLIVTVFTYRGV